MSESNNYTSSETTCLLDFNYSSKLLSSKIQDIPQKYKYEIIVAPIFECYLGTSDDSVWERIENVEDIMPQYETFNKLTIDWVRDQNYIFEQVLDLFPFSLIKIVKELDLLNNRSFVKLSLEYGSYILEEIDSKFRNDKEIVMTAVREYGLSLSVASDELKDDIDVVREAVYQDGEAYCYASERLRSVREIALIAVKTHSIFTYLPNELRHDIEIIKLELQHNKETKLLDLPNELQLNKEIVLTAIRNNVDYNFISIDLRNEKDIIHAIAAQNLHELSKLSEEMKNDKELFLELVNKFKRSFQYASETLRNDRELVEIAIKDGNNLEFAKQFQNDKEIVKLAILQYAPSLEYASDDLKNDKEIVKLAVIKDGIALRYASIQLRDDYEIVELAVNSNGFAIENASERLVNDKNIVLQCFNRRGISFDNIPSKFRNDRDVILKAVQSNGDNLQQVAEEFKQDREILLEAVKSNGQSLQYPIDREMLELALSSSVPPSSIDYTQLQFQMDRELLLIAAKRKASLIYGASEELLDEEIIIEAIRQDPIIILSLPHQVRNNKELMLKALEIDEFIYSCLMENLTQDIDIVMQLAKHHGLSCDIGKFKRNREIIKQAIKKNGNSFNKASVHFKNQDRLLALLAVKQDGTVLRFLNYKYRNDREIVMAAIKQNKEAMKYVSFQLFQSFQLRNDEKLETCVRRRYINLMDEITLTTPGI